MIESRLNKLQVILSLLLNLSLLSGCNPLIDNLFFDLFFIKLKPKTAALGVLVIGYGLHDASHEVALFEGLGLLDDGLAALPGKVCENTRAPVHLCDLLSECLLESIGLYLEGEFVHLVGVVHKLVDLLHVVLQQPLVGRAQGVKLPLRSLRLKHKGLAVLPQLVLATQWSEGKRVTEELGEVEGV